MTNEETPIPDVLKKILPDDVVFKEDLLKAAKFASDRSIGVDDDIIPHLLVFTANKEGEKAMSVMVIASPFNEWEEKSAIMKDLGARIARDKEIPTHIILTSMAWMSHNLSTQPRNDKDKKEVILVLGLSMDQRGLVSIAEVFREDNKIVKVDKFEEIVVVAGDLLPCFYHGFVTEFMRKKR